MGALTLTSEPLSYFDQVKPSFRRPETVGWLHLLKALMEPAVLLERGLSEVDSLQKTLKRQPRKAAVVGTNVPALLATIFLRLRGAEAVTLGSVPQPLFSPSRLKGLPGWKHVWMSPALAQTELVEETGARYASSSDVSFECATERFGPFELIVAAETESSSMLGLARGLANHGVLVDLTLGDNTLETWTACPGRDFLVKHQVTVGAGGTERLLAERATRDLALADALHPGWLARMLESFVEARHRPVLLES